MNESQNDNIIDDFFDQVDNKEEEIVSLEVQQNNRMMSMQNEVKLELLNFTKSLIKKANAKNELRDTVTSILMARLSDEEEVESISTATLLRALEIMNKGDNDFIASILNSFKSSASLNINVGTDGSNNNSNPISQSQQKEKELNSINKDDFQAVKNVLGFLDKIKKSGEFPELNDEQV